jgi:hypothetical protein
LRSEDELSLGSRIVAETVQHFITAMDSLKLNMVAADQLQPLLSDLCESLHKVRALPPDWEHRQKLHSWLQVMTKMKASDELQAEQSRQVHQRSSFLSLSFCSFFVICNVPEDVFCIQAQQSEQKFVDNNSSSIFTEGTEKTY